MKLGPSAPLLWDPAARDRSANSLSIFAIVPTLNPYGGVISVVNLSNILIDKGHRVVIGSMSVTGVDIVHPRTEPLHMEDLPDGLAGSFDVVIATSWDTVDRALVLAESMAAIPVYFVQGFEPDLYSDPKSVARARDTYEKISNRVVKTRYLQDRLMSEGGWHAERIPPGMNLDLFYPRSRLSVSEPPVVVSMARPDAPSDHRGFEILKAVYKELHRRRPDVVLEAFGVNDSSLFSCPVRVLGRVPPIELAIHYSSATVFVDTSRIHGFGRTGVEAMACGAACVLSDSGGISEYAVHGENALIVPVGDVGETVKAIERLLDDPPLRGRLIEAGLKAVSGLSDSQATDALVEILARVARQN